MLQLSLSRFAGRNSEISKRNRFLENAFSHLGVFIRETCAPVSKNGSYTHPPSHSPKMRSTPIWRASLTYLQQAQAVSADAFNYFLPKSHIATAPLRDRSASKLLVVRGAAASLETKLFSDLPSLLPADSLVVRNTSRVIPARLPMLKRTGGRAEVMLLSPVGDADPTKVLQSDEACTRWNCFIGGRRIKEGDLLQANLGGRREWKGLALVAKVAGKDGRDAVVDLSVQKSSGGLPVNLDVTRGVGGISLNEAISQVGRTPLPPYIPREDKPFDRETYQTVYATTEGSVAAPTAGLHVTEGVMEELRRRGVRFADVLLHVGAGTFAPVGGGCAGGHAMHEERTVGAYGEIEAVLRHLEEKKPIIALVRQSFPFSVFVRGV